MSEIRWPDNLIEELTFRRCIFFLGSGVSASSVADDGTRPQTWGEFLNKAKELLVNPTSSDKKFIRGMLAQNNYLLALQAINNLADPGSYTAFLRRSFNNPIFKPSELHSCIRDIDCKIVMTTNFDKIYDNLCNDTGYVVCNYQETPKIISNIKTSNRLIIKTHGSIDDTEHMVFTQKDYYDARSNFPQFYKLLEALFLTNTVVFIGYSLNDPDINLILENVSNSTNSGCPHYVVTSKAQEHMKKHWRDSYNISCLEYGEDHNELLVNLKKLQLIIDSERKCRGMW
jgi:hypothetical protein